MSPTRLVRAAVTAVFALTLTTLLPTAFANAHHHPGPQPAARTGPEQQIPGLTRAALVDRAKRLLPHGVVSTEPFESGTSKRTYIDNTQDKSPTTDGGLSITFNPDGTVWMVDCDATTPRPDDNVVLRFCTDLDYTGANPPAIRSWVHTTFSHPVNGLSLQQRRSLAAWILSVDNYGDGLQFGIDIQPNY